MVDTDPWAINASGGAPAYSAVELRRLDAVLLWAGTGDRLGAHEGVRPGHVPVSLVGTTWTVHDVPAVVYPAVTSTSGPYRVALLETAGAVNPAEAQPRKDILYARVQDDDEDSSGQRRALPGYLPGSASGTPVEPTVPDGAFKLGTIDVPASGGGDPTLTITAPFAVASGGILPVRTSGGLPSSGVTEGMAAFQMDADSLVIHDGTGFKPVASTKVPTQQKFTSSGTWTKPAGLKFAVVEVQGGGGAGGGAPATSATQSSSGTGGQGGAYARTVFAGSVLGASEPVTVGAAGAGASGASGASGGTSSFGSAATLVSAGGGAGGQAIVASAGEGAGHGADTSQSITGQVQVGGGGGGAGMRGWSGNTCFSGAGGGSYLGNGGGGKGGPSSNGAAGKGYGGGGGGASNLLSQGARPGGNGAPGIVIVTEYF